jgi:hypothetical protein
MMAGEDVYVLTTLQGEGKNREWRPVGVVTNVKIADQWVAEGSSNDWIPFALDDISMTALSAGNITPWKPRNDAAEAENRASKAEAETKRVIEVAQKLEETNQRFLKIIERLQKQLGVRGKVKDVPTPVPQKASLLEEEEG